MGGWRGREVLVTGASGLLGSAMVHKLCERGASVTCLVRDWVPASRLFAEGLAERANVVRGPLEDYETVLRALNEYEVDTVFHLGAQTIVGTASRSPLSTFESNVKGTWVLLEACRQLPKVRRVLVASSDKAYGEHEVLPFTEDAPLVGKYPYDVSKSCTDLISLSYYHSFALPVAVTRCGNLYGPGDLNWNRLGPGTIRSPLAGERPVVRSDGSFVRDMNSSPLAEAVVRSINEIAHVLDKRSIAEHTETERDRQALIALGVDYAQGFGIDRPVPIADYFAEPSPGQPS